MKQTVGNVVGLIPLLLVIALMGCVSAKHTAEQTSVDTTYISETGVLEVENDTSIVMAVFTEHTDRVIYLGTIPAHRSQRFDISKIPEIPLKSTFVLRTVNAEDYVQNGSLAKTVYTALVMYDLNTSDQKITVSIPYMIGGEGLIYVSNESPYFAEIRVDDPNGRVLSVLVPAERDKSLWLFEEESGLPYKFYVRYLYINPASGDLNRTEVNPSDSIMIIPVSSYSYAHDIPHLSFKAPQEFVDVLNKGEINLWAEMTKINYTVAFIKIKNDSNGVISFLSGRARLKNQRGTITVSPGRIDTFELSGEAGKLYSDLSLEHDSGNLKLNPITIKPGYEYEFIVTQQYGNIVYSMRELGVKE